MVQDAAGQKSFFVKDPFRLNIWTKKFILCLTVVDIKCRCFGLFSPLCGKDVQNRSFPVAAGISSVFVSVVIPLLVFQIVRLWSMTGPTPIATPVIAGAVGRGYLCVRLTAYQYPCIPSVIRKRTLKRSTSWNRYCTIRTTGVHNQRYYTIATNICANFWFRAHYSTTVILCWFGFLLSVRRLKWKIITLKTLLLTRSF